MKIKLLILISITLLISCSKQDDLNENGVVLNSFIRQEIQINSGDTLKINLGNFGDEEGARILKNPNNAKINILYRDFTSSQIFYEYSPLDYFKGKDTVGLVLNRGSDGASPGFNDTTRICITTN